MWIVPLLLALWYLALLWRMTPLPLNHDELDFLLDALRLPAQRRLAGYMHGSLLFELIAAAEVVFYAVLRGTRSVTSSFDFLVLVLSNVDRHLFVCRLLVAATAVATVAQLTRIGMLFGGTIVGILAALLCATNFTFISLTTICKEDALSWLLTLLAMECAWRAARTQSKRAAWLAGIAIGAATAAKFLAVFGGALAILPLLRIREIPRTTAVKLALTIAFVAAGTFFLLFPFLITDTAAVFASVRRVDTVMASMGTHHTLPEYLAGHLPNLVGPFVLALGIIELIRRLLRDPWGPVALLIVPLLQLVFMGTKRGYSMAHYIFPLAMFFFILASSLIVDVARRLSARYRSGAAAAVLLIAILDPAYARSSAKYGLVLTGADTRIIAKEEFMKLARPGDCVTISQAITGENVFGPQLAPAEVAETRGPYGRALEQAVQRRGEPRFRLRMVPGEDVTDDQARDCAWVIAARPATRLSGREQGRPAPIVIDDPKVPGGFTLVRRINAFPEQHSVWYPYPTSLDYEDIRRIPWSVVEKDRKIGMSVFIYKRDAHQ